MVLKNICFACGKTRKLSSEHIIPQAIGGRLKEYLYCVKCNSEFGRNLDDEMAKNFGIISTVLGIKTERNTRKAHIVENIATKTKLLYDGKGIKRKCPIVDINVDGSILVSADIYTGSEKERDRIAKSLTDKYKFPVEQSKSFVEITRGPVDARYQFVLDSKILRRAIAKVAYSFICTKLPPSVILTTAFDEIRTFITTGNCDNIGSLNFSNTRFMSDYIRPRHSIHISHNRQNNMLVAYIMLFGIFRYTILVTRGYYSPIDIADMNYTYDPILRREVPRDPQFRAPLLTVKQVTNPSQSKRIIDYEVGRGMRMLNNFSDQVKFIGSE